MVELLDLCFRDDGVVVAAKEQNGQVFGDLLEEKEIVLGEKREFELLLDLSTDKVG